MELGLKGKRIAILVADGVDESALAGPRAALEAAGAVAEVVSASAGEIRCERKGDVEVTIPVDRALADCGPADYAALVIPDGGANGSTLHDNAKAVQFVREFMAADKPVAASGHAPQLLIDADAVGGRTLTSSPELRKAIEASGGHWVDTPVHVDERLITSRAAADLPAFSARVVREFTNRLDERRVDQLSEQSFPASDPAPMP